MPGMHPLTWLDDGRRDLWYAARTLRRNPGFTAVAVLTLALGIGANTAVFSVVKAVLLRPLSFAGADRLVTIYEHVPASESPDGKPHRIGGMLAGDFIERKSRVRALSHIASYGVALVTSAGGSDAVRLTLVSATSDLFSMLDARPILGRPLTAADEQPGAERVVVLSYAAWQRQFGADPAAVGKPLSFRVFVADHVPLSVRTKNENACRPARGSYTITGIGRPRIVSGLERA